MSAGLFRILSASFAYRGVVPRGRIAFLFGSRWISSGCRGALLLCEGSVSSDALTGGAELFACLVSILMGQMVDLCWRCFTPRCIERAVSLSDL